MSARRLFFLFCYISLHFCANAQADNEIQVYASPTIQYKWTIFELHSNYTFKGSKLLSDPATANWTNETLEITVLEKISKSDFILLHDLRRAMAGFNISAIKYGHGLLFLHPGIGMPVQAFRWRLVFSDLTTRLIFFGRVS